MQFHRSDLFAVLLSLLLVSSVLSVIACDVRDIPLGTDPGKVTEAVGGSGAIDDGIDMDNPAEQPGFTGDNDSRSGDGQDAEIDPDHRDRQYGDAERRDVGEQIDSGSDGDNVDPEVDFEACGLTYCPPGYVCCESCGNCTPPGACPQDCWESIQPEAKYCDSFECGAPPGRVAMSCPLGMLGGPLCMKTDDGTCAWQIVPCYNPMSVPCGESVGHTCTPFEYCDAPDCGEGTRTGFCQFRPTGCSRVFEPVCGCDGNDYGNRCLAQAAGTNVAFEGSCR